MNGAHHRPNLTLISYNFLRHIHVPLTPRIKVISCAEFNCTKCRIIGGGNFISQAMRHVATGGGLLSIQFIIHTIFIRINYISISKLRSAEILRIVVNKARFNLHQELHFLCIRVIALFVGQLLHYRQSLLCMKKNFFIYSFDFQTFGT